MIKITSSIKMIRGFFQTAPAPMFLSSFFKSTEDSFHDEEFVEIDIQRDGEDIAFVVKDGCTGYNVNDNSIWTNKKFKPPMLAEKIQFNACNLVERQMGDNPYESPGFMAKALRKIFNSIRKLLPKFRRTIELQASTILQTGVCSLPNEEGDIEYTLDYQAKASHYPVAGTVWGDPADDKIGDVKALAKLNRTDGKRRSDILIFGDKAWEEWISDEEIQKRLDNKGMNVGEVAPVDRAEDATFQGWIRLGDYRYEMWTYDGYYRDPVSGNLKEYVESGNVIVMSSKARLQATFGGVGRFVPPEARALAFVPRVARSAAARMGLTLNAWFEPDGETFTTGFRGRPLLVPVEIDSFGCLDTGL